jgi:cytochrome c556
MPQKRLATPLMTALLCAGLAAPSLASDDSLQEAIDYRSGVMNVFSWNLSSMGAMLKDKVPYDQTAFTRHAMDLANATALDVLSGFPEDSVSEDSAAMSEIWLDWSDFTDKFQDFQKQSTKLAQIAIGGDKAAIAEQFEATRKTCKACHRKFKE